MLLTHAAHLPSGATYSLHAISPDSPKVFDERQPLPSPTTSDENRSLVPPRTRFDVLVANLVVHHVDDLDGFFAGVVGLVKPGGWVVITEFGLEEGQDHAEAAPHKSNKAGEIAQGKVSCRWWILLLVPFPTS